VALIENQPDFSALSSAFYSHEWRELHHRICEDLINKDCCIMDRFAEKVMAGFAHPTCV